MGDFQPSSGGGRVGTEKMMIIIILPMNRYFPSKAIWCSGKDTNKYLLSIYYVPGYKPNRQRVKRWVFANWVPLGRLLNLNLCFHNRHSNTYLAGSSWKMKLGLVARMWNAMTGIPWALTNLSWIWVEHLCIGPWGRCCEEYKKPEMGTLLLKGLESSWRNRTDA